MDIISDDMWIKLTYLFFNVTETLLPPGSKSKLFCSPNTSLVISKFKQNTSSKSGSL